MSSSLRRSVAPVARSLFSRVSTRAISAPVAAASKLSRSFTSNAASSTTTLSSSSRPSSSFSRSIQTLNFGGSKEEVVSRTDYPKERIQQLLGNQTFAMLGYGTQGRGQALNLRDNGIKVIIGLREGKSWELAKSDGFVPGETLFPIPEAAKRGNTIMYLLSDASQKSEWASIQPHVTTGKTLFFSHGFSIVYKDQTGVIPPKDVDVVLVAPKGSGTNCPKIILRR